MVEIPDVYKDLVLVKKALAHLAIDNRRTAAWHTLGSLAMLVGRHRTDDSINKAIAN